MFNNAYLKQHLECAAPKPWSKYSTINSKGRSGNLLLSKSYFHKIKVLSGGKCCQIWSFFANLATFYEKMRTKCLVRLLNNLATFKNWLKTVLKQVLNQFWTILEPVLKQFWKFCYFLIYLSGNTGVGPFFAKFCLPCNKYRLSV